MEKEEKPTNIEVMPTRFDDSLLKKEMDEFFDGWKRSGLDRPRDYVYLLIGIEHRK